MAFTDTKEKGLETLIADYLVTKNHYELGSNNDYNRDFAVDETRLFRFLNDTQPDQMKKLRLEESENNKKKFLARISSEITGRGIVDVLRNGIHAYPADLIMFYVTPSENNIDARMLFEKNIFSVTRQLEYSQVNPRLAVDMCLFINGLPVITFELKNQLTNQNTLDAVHQYMKDRSPKELLFMFKRCMVHFAVDDNTIQFCTKLEEEDSNFLPFNKGNNDSAGNPVNPQGLKTSYLWEDILKKRKLSRIIENYAQVVEKTDKDTKKKSYTQIFPRYHQLDTVEALLKDVKTKGIGQNYLIQHSAGSGKSNSIAWLAHQLIELEKDNKPMIDSVIVVTDRKILDKQIRDTIKQFMQVSNTVYWAEHSSTLKNAIEKGKRIIITTIEKFPYISSDMGSEHKNHKFAIIIDEAHSGQNGDNSANMNIALSGGLAANEDLDNEDKINILMDGRKLIENASYFAFTATPKNKTLQTFGTKFEEDGQVKYRPFKTYTMKQAIEEGFILDVLKNYTSIDSYYKIKKTIEDDPLFDKKKAQKKLRAFVESDSYTIAQKAAMMVDHFHDIVIAKRKINGRARAMVITQSIPRCVEYFFAINKCLEERNSPYKAIIAYSGEHKHGGEPLALTSSARNGFADAEIPDKFKKDPYRILVVADMFQTGFDEPLLHTMYVDKQLSGIKAVQTLSRLNRCCKYKTDTCVLDFYNKPEMIQDAFKDYYKTTILSGETDPNKLYDLIEELEIHQVYSPDDVKNIVNLYLDGAQRDTLDPVLDSCAERYKELDEEDKVKFKGTAKAFCRTYGFLGSILPYGNPDWERLSIFLNLLIPKLPSPKEDDMSEGITEVIDLDSYRLEARESLDIALQDQDGEIAPVPTGQRGFKADPELDHLSAIITSFNDLFGNTQWSDADSVQNSILELPMKVSKNQKYQNAMKNSDEQEARTECEHALQNVMLGLMRDNIELFKMYQDNDQFKQWLNEMVFTQTYSREG